MRVRKNLLFTIFILASAGSLYGQGWTFNDGTLNVTSQIWVQSYEFGNTHPSTYNGTPYSEYHDQIKTIILADNITYVGERAFAQCSVAERLVVGKGVKKFAYSAFHFPKSTLKTIEWNAANANIITQYQYSVIQYSYEGPFGRKETYVDVVNCNYAANAETIIFGPDVVSIPDYFAYFMKKLKKVEFGAKVTSIGMYAFVGITPSTVLIARMPNPSSVTLGNTYYNPFPASASDRNKITLKVPAEYINQYKAANIWKDFNIVALENSTEDEPSETQTGVLVGAFSVSSTRKVHFSRGNLQYQASTKKWRFALNQYDYIGSANSNISSTYSGWIDLFGYGTSGWNSGFYAYRPYASDSYDGSYINKDLTGAYANADWGVYNAISNGGNQAGLWRTMTETEWKYLLQERPNADIRLSVGKVNSVSGLILLPDDWVLPEGLTFTPKGSSYDSNKYNTTQWQEMANAGAVFLPAAGWRVIDEVRTTWSSGGIGLRGVYHGSTIADPSASTKKSYAITFYSDKIGGGINARECGLSVRLVQDVLGYTITFVDADGNTIGSPQVVEPGQSATPPTPPTRANYNFAGWIGNYQNVTADATIYASYEHTNLGIFSISDTETVLFSQGNLQYHATAGTHKCADGSTKQGVWRFAEHQWDYVGDDTNGTVYGNGVKSNNALISSTYNGWIDLFGWGTSGWESGANAYQPWAVGTNDQDYYPGGSYTYSLQGSYANADWGVYNAIKNGSNNAGMWRTLTASEWNYILFSRASADQLLGKATVNGVRGFIVLPDKWELPQGLQFNASISAWTANQYNEEEWKLMENNGAVFFPYGMRRIYGTTLGESGGYWTASVSEENPVSSALGMAFDKDNCQIMDGGRHNGHLVRLIKDVICHTITFEANGGVIPTTGNMGKQFAVHKTSLSADQTYGTVTVRSGYSFFATMTNDCPSREGYTFAGWYTDPTSGVQVYDNTGYRVVGTYWNSEGKWIGTSNVTLYAHWTPIPYTITVNSSNVSQGSASGGGTYDYGTNHQTTATPNECYRFVQWSDGNTDNPRTITVTGDATYTAEFEQIQYTIEAQSADAGQGSATVTNP